MRRVVVTGLGMVTPLGCGVEPTWSRLLEGKSGANRIEGFKIDAVRAAVGDRGQVNQAIGRSADRLHHDLRIPERGFRQQFARLRPLGLGHFGGDPAARLRQPKAFGMGRRDRRAHRQRQAERFGDARHGGGRPHHHAGADRRRQPAVDRLDFDIVDFTGAVFSP